MTTDADPLDLRYRDSSLPIAERVEILLGQMTVEEKAGLLFHTMITMGPDGTLSSGDASMGLPSTAEYISDRHITHFNLRGYAPTAREMAEWHNRLQRLAASTRLGIPVTISTDPRHSFADNPGVAMSAGPFSLWPEPLGLAATRDPALVREFADIARQEYLAVGIRVALHPQVDLATEPRWARALQTFGEDVELVSELGVAYVRGLQGESLGPGSVSAMVKHFPGGGPQKDGEDPHFPYGREQVYPGGEFDLHLEPFLRVFAAGASQVMPYYGMPIGTEHEEVGFGFNRSVLTGLLRERLGFAGIVCTDWGLITDRRMLGQSFPARAWGVEHLSPRERMRMILNAGADQFGGEHCTELLLDLVSSGDVPQERLDDSARRLLSEKFALGLFDDPYVDVDAADGIVGSPRFRAAGEAAQRASITVLADDESVLPLAAGARLYVEGIDAATATGYGEVVAAPEDADVAVLRIQAPYDERTTAFENLFHAGSLEFSADTVEHIARTARRVPTVVDVFLDRPALLEPVVDAASAVVANWGASAGALLDVLFGRAPASGRLPFDVPRSTAAVEASRPDVPFDTHRPLFRFGHRQEL